MRSGRSREDRATCETREVVTAHVTTARQRNPGANTGAVRALLRTLEAETTHSPAPRPALCPPPPPPRHPLARTDGSVRAALPFLDCTRTGTSQPATPRAWLSRARRRPPNARSSPPPSRGPGRDAPVCLAPRAGAAAEEAAVHVGARAGWARLPPPVGRGVSTRLVVEEAPTRSSGTAGPPHAPTRAVGAVPHTCAPAFAPVALSGRSGLSTHGGFGPHFPSSATTRRLAVRVPFHGFTPSALPPG